MNINVDVSGVVLTTERLILREFKLSDLDDLFEYLKDEDIGPMAGFAPLKNKEEALKTLNSFIERKNAFCLEYDKKVIGSISFENYDEVYQEFDHLKGKELGFDLAKPYWGQSLMPEALKRVMRYLFENYDLDFITCGNFKTNIQSTRVQEKCGFSFYKNRLYIDHKKEYQDSLAYIIFKDGFLKNKLLYNSLFFNYSNVVVNNDDYLEIDDKKANIYHIFTKKEGLPIFNLIDKNKNKRKVLCLTSKDDLNINIIPPFHNLRKTVQYSYIGDLKEINCQFKIKEFEEKNYDYFHQTYDYDGIDRDDYLKGIYSRGMLEMVNEKDEIIGYIGTHPELTVGCLYIDPNYRRMGLGKSLEQAMINKVLKRGITPIDHVIISNAASHKLQGSFNGMKLDEGFVYWLF